MPIFKTKNEKFFKEWSAEMAYVLGFFIADGSMIINKRGGRYIDFWVTDYDILKRIRKVLGSNHKIKKKKRRKEDKAIYRLQIGSKEMFDDLLKLSVKPNKTGYEKMPKVAKEYLADFVRGYFDGDGTVSFSNYYQKDRDEIKKIIISGFTCKSKSFLEEIKERLYYEKVVNGSTLYYGGRAWRLRFSINDSRKLYDFMYSGKCKNGLYLKRKRNVFEKFFKMDP